MSVLAQPSSDVLAHQTLLAFIRANGIVGVAGGATDEQLLETLRLERGVSDVATVTPTPCRPIITPITETETTPVYFVALYMYSERNKSKLVVTRYPLAYAMTASIAECEPVVPLLILGSLDFVNAMYLWNLWSQHCTKLQTKWVRGMLLFATFRKAHSMCAWCYTSDDPALIQAISRWAVHGCARGRVTF